MKKIALILVAGLAFAACSQPAKDAENNNAEETVENTETLNVYGEDFAEESVLMASSLPALMDGHAKKEVTVKGEVAAVCKKKGCWMDIKLDNGEEMKVTFKDYGFFVPMDIETQTVVMHGVASYDTLDVDYLKHIAEDAGKSEEEIAQIMEPQVALVFEATGVKLEE